jgi:2-oxoglutarate ferredoxin oxidoreductase subunit beta
VEGAGASYVARYTVAHIHLLIKSIKTALTRSNFSFIEAISPCPTHIGKMNASQSAVEMFRELKQYYLPLAKYQKMPPEEKMKYQPVGEFVK